MKIEARAIFDSSAAIAFATASDIDAWPEIVEGVRRIQREDDRPVGKGTRFREMRRLYGSRAVETLTFTEFDPPRRFVLAAQGQGVDYETEHVFTALGAETEVIVSFTATPVGTFGKLLAPIVSLFAANLRKTLIADLTAIKREAERRTAAKAPAA